MTEIIMVNENDNIIGSKERYSIVHKDIYRVSSLWIKNTKGQSLLAKRALSKQNNPGK